MRVMCIDDQWTSKPGHTVPSIAYGETVTVIDHSKDEDGDWYEFAEYEGYQYESCAFVPLSDEDETKRIDEVLENIFVKTKI